MAAQVPTILLLAEPDESGSKVVLLREGVVALARAVLARNGTLIVPAHPLVACLAVLVAAESHEPTALESAEVQGPAPVTVVPWPTASSEGVAELLEAWQT